jgi:hypothetical protein
MKVRQLTEQRMLFWQVPAGSLVMLEMGQPRHARGVISYMRTVNQKFKQPDWSYAVSWCSCDNECTLCSLVDH